LKKPVPFSTYESTRLGADTQRRVNVYSNSKRGVRQFPGIVEFSDFGVPTFLQTSDPFSVHLELNGGDLLEDSSGNGIVISDDFN